MSIPPQVKLRGLKNDVVEILNCSEMEKYIHFWAERCQKDALFQRKLQIKVFQHRISYKKVCKVICLSISPQSGAKGLERWYGWNIKLYRNGKIHSLLGWTLPKRRIIPKKNIQNNESVACVQNLSSLTIFVPSNFTFDHEVHGLLIVIRIWM